MSETKVWIRLYLEQLYKELNEYYIGIIGVEKLNAYIETLMDLDLSNTEILKIIDEDKAKLIEEYIDMIENKKIGMNDNYYVLNDLFCYIITNDVLHIHVIPKSVKRQIDDVGIKSYLEKTEELLQDVFVKIAEILNLEKNSNVNMIFAVSRLLHSKHVKPIFEKYDFHVKTSDKQYFVNRFKTKKEQEKWVKTLKSPKPSSV